MLAKVRFGIMTRKMYMKLLGLYHELEKEKTMPVSKPDYFGTRNVFDPELYILDTECEQREDGYYNKEGKKLANFIFISDPDYIAIVSDKTYCVNLNKLCNSGFKGSFEVVQFIFEGEVI